MHTQLPHIPVIVIGAGFSGVAMGAQLKRKLGLHDYVIYERSPDFGGTWWANVYPGCAVDIPSIFYSLSFAPNPDFSQLFPDQSEILRYIKDVAKKFDVDTHIRVNMSWDDATWEEATKTWSVRLRDTQTGEIFLQECNILISGVGGLVNPNPCTIPGADTFEGAIAHTARWRKDIVLENKNVIVIGNGCSGSQVVPAIADKVKNIYQFVRSPQFYFPQNNITIHPSVKWAFRYVPFLMVFLRYAMFNFMEYWFIQFYTNDRGNRHRLMKKKLSDNYVEKTAPKEYWDLLKPTYKVGCKRRVFDSGYLRSLHRDNVHLTNDAIVMIQPTEVITESGKHYPADVIILANGFAMADYSLNVVGRDGVTPQMHWQKMGGISAYKSTACSAFPNFFILLGPNAATGHTSALFSIENTINLIIKLARPILQKKQAEVVVKFDHEKDYCVKQQAALQNRVWADCRSYYKDEKGWNFTMYPWSSYTMWWESRFPDMNAWAYSK
ncbi:hypothetical protein PILCRDRAFT_812480 [Piloderma croceum F 1598]|uniref:FAD/NAD(P)-binding domain-containing protein n=1 Tax=Piloderma croceum (strain F 1598) TaxID=765440 RepID=A0A0C3BT26_PILCF|nr:hypothetical protein PILCRDRAFT_812480 [Piloderma croceum F 1598]